MITSSEKKEMVSFMKKRYPIGTPVYDSVRGYQPFYIKKNTVFEVFEWDYSDKMRPDEDKDIYVDFFVRDPGATTPRYELKSWPKAWVLKKYLEKYYPELKSKT